MAKTLKQRKYESAERKMRGKASVSIEVRQDIIDACGSKLDAARILGAAINGEKLPIVSKYSLADRITEITGIPCREEKTTVRVNPDGSFTQEWPDGIKAFYSVEVVKDCAAAGMLSEKAIEFIHNNTSLKLKD